MRDRGIPGGAVANAALNAASFAFNLVTALLLSRFLGAAGYGAYAFALAWSTLLAVPAVLGLPSLIVREIVTYRVHHAWGNVRGIIRRSNQAALATSLTVSLAFASLLWLIDWPPQRLLRPTLVALLLVPLVVLVSMRQSVMQGFGRVVLGRTPEALASPFFAILLLVTLKVSLGGRFSATWALGATVAGASVAAVIGVGLLRRTIPSQVRDATPEYETRSWVLRALPLIAMAAIQTANAQLAVILLGALDSSREAGVFSVANRAAGLMAFLLLATVPTLMPTIAELHERTDTAALQRAVTRAARYVFLGSLPLALVLVAFAGPVLSVFGSDFRSGSTALRILCLGQLVNVATGFVGTILIMIGRAGRLTVGVAAGTALNLGLCAVLIPALGVEGAAIAGAASLAFTNLVLAFMLWHRERIYSPAVGYLGRR